MFAIGLALQRPAGRVRFLRSARSASRRSPISAWAIPYFIARVIDLGQGIVTAASYEYGNTFLIVAGLLNMLVAIDAYDVRMGRK